MTKKLLLGEKEIPSLSQLEGNYFGTKCADLKFSHDVVGSSQLAFSWQKHQALHYELKKDVTFVMSASETEQV
jgi:hypothetical protein